MEQTPIILAVVGLVISAFSLGWSLNNYRESEARVRVLVRKRIEAALDERELREQLHEESLNDSCAVYLQAKWAEMANTSETRETTKEAMDK